METERIVLPADHFNKRIHHQYNDVGEALVREILQNSNDAGAKNVWWTTHDHAFRAEDDGCGMDLDKFRRVFLTLGGTEKANYCPACDAFTQNDSCPSCGGAVRKPSGGFGAAKELVLFAWNEWRAEGQGFQVSGSGASNPISDSGGIPKGFAVQASDKEFEARTFEGDIGLITALSRLRCKVHHNGWEVSQGRSLRSNQIVREWDWGTLYVYKGGNLKSRESEGMLYVRTRGLYSFCSGVYGTPLVFYLDITSPSSEILTENREALRREYDRMVDAAIELVKVSGAEEAKHEPKITIFGFDQQPAAERLDDEYQEQVLEYSHQAGGRSNAGSFASVSVAGLRPGAVPAKVSTEGMGEAELEVDWTQLWRKQFAIADESGCLKLRQILAADKTSLKPKLNKALEVWTVALNLVADCLGIARPIPGLILGSKESTLHGLYTSVMNRHVVFVRPDDALNEPAFVVLEEAMHELAHAYAGGHYATYESKRLWTVAKGVGADVVRVVGAIGYVQGQAARRGRYWE